MNTDKLLEAIENWYFTEEQVLKELLAYLWNYEVGEFIDNSPMMVDLREGSEE